MLACVQQYCRMGGLVLACVQQYCRMGGLVAMATPEAIHCIGCAKDISKSSRDRRKLGPDSTATVWMEVSLQEAAAAISLQSI